MRRATVFLCLAAVACGGAADRQAPAAPPPAPPPAQGSLRVTDAWVRVQGDITLMSAAYFTLHNTDSVPVIIRGVSCRDVQLVTVHESYIEAGLARMRARDSLTLAGGGSVAMAPGGIHLMMMGLAKPLNVGESASCTVRSNAGDVAVEAAVRAR